MCGCACMCTVHLSTCLVTGSFHHGSVGGRAALQHCDEINDPWFFRCDQQTKLSAHSETKGVMGGKAECLSTEATDFQNKCTGSHASAALSGASRQAPNINTYSHTIYFSLSPLPPTPPSSSHFPPETLCQMLPGSHICAENELYPRALWVKDSLVKNAVLLDEQTNVPCNVVALAFYATLKESINLHNSSEHVLPL